MRRNILPDSPSLAHHNKRKSRMRSILQTNPVRCSDKTGKGALEFLKQAKTKSERRRQLIAAATSSSEKFHVTVKDLQAN